MPLEGRYEPSAWDWVRDQVELYESSGGTEGTTIRGRPVIVMTNRGVKSGALRKTPLMRVEHNGSYAAVGSQGGLPVDPAWVANVRAEPLVELQDGPVKQDMLARELTGDERSVWWRRAVDAYPPYREYQFRTTRTIPVFVLEPISS